MIVILLVGLHIKYQLKTNTYAAASSCKKYKEYLTPLVPM